MSILTKKGNRDNHEQDKFIESTSIPGQVAIAVVSPDGTNVGGGTQYADGASAATPTGTQINWNNGGTQASVSTSKPLPIQLRNSSGTEIGTASNPVRTDPTGTTNQPVNIAQVGGASIATGHGTASGAIRVELPTDSTGVVGLAAGSQIVGKVGIDQTTPGTTNAVAIGDGAGNALTSNSTTYTAKKALDANILGTLGTAFSTAGKVDVKAADGDVFVRSNAASTFPTQATLQTQTDTVMIGGVNIKEINAVTPLMGAGNGGTGSLRVNIASDQVSIPVGATLAAETTKVLGVTRTADGGGNLLTSNSTTYTAKFALDENLLGTLGTAFTDAGKVNVQGGVATNTAVADKLLNNGAQGVSSENSAVTTGRMVQLVADLVGKLIVLPYSNPENFVSGRATATDTTSTSLIAAPASGLRNYITQITVWNSSATSTYIKIQDGSGGTELYDIPAPAGGGATLTLPTPLRQPTTATALFFAANASANAVFVSVSGYKGA